MRQVFLGSFMILITLGLLTQDASAGRFGGARGFHAMRGNTLFTRAYGVKRPLHATIAKRATTSKWRGALTGFLMGSLLTSLFMGHGFGSLIMSWFFLGLILLLIMRFLQHRKSHPSDTE